MAGKAKPVSRDYVRHAKSPAWGVGVLVKRTREQRTYLFADGVARSFKEEFCERYIERAEAPEPEDRARLERGLAVNLAIEAQMMPARDDPGAYLVYADWLQHQRDPRGELITVQHQLAADPDNKKLRAAEAALMDAHGAYLRRSTNSRSYRRRGQ